MKAIKKYSFLALLVMSGCMSASWHEKSKIYQSKEEFLDYIMAGYVTDIPNLYVDDWQGKNSRLKELHRGLGLENVNTFHIMNKGQLLVFEKFVNKLEPNELGTLVLSADSPPKMLRTPKELSIGQCRVFRYTNKAGKQCFLNGLERFRSTAYDCQVDPNDYFQFYNGFIIDPNSGWACLDKEGRFFCYREDSEVLGYLNGDSKASERTYIIPVSHPEKKILSHLKNFPRSMIVNRNRLYLATQTYHKDLPVIHVEVFDILQEDELSYVKDYYFDPPWGFTASLCVFCDFDYLTNCQLINVWRKWTFGGNRYLYNYDDNSLEKAPYGHVNFIDPAILKNSVQYVDLEKTGK